MKQYSKRIVKALIAVWFAGAAFGAFCVAAELLTAYVSPSYVITVHLPELLTYIGGPTSCGIIGYLAKSAFENREKIKQQYIPDYDSQE